MDRTLTFYHAPNTRSSGIRVLLEELKAPHVMHVLDRAKNEHRQTPFLEINPLGKVPAITYAGHVVTEQPAIILFLADLFPAAGLAPAVDDPLRGPYLRWMFLYGSVFEPAIIDFALKRDPGPLAMSPYGSYEAVIDLLEAQLRPGPWLLGDRFTAADVLWGTALTWTMMFKVVPERPVFLEYAKRLRARPAYIHATAADQALASEQEAAAG
jgi:glutathione S-transferase